MLLFPCGQHSETQQKCHPWLLLWQLSLPSPPPFTTQLFTWYSNPISASHYVGMWPNAEAHSVDVCARTALHRREHADSLITMKSAIQPGCPTDYLRTTGPADTVPALKQTQVPGRTVETTVPNKQPESSKDLCTARWLSVSSPMKCRATSFKWREKN